jgi:cell division protein FtsB
MKRVILALLVIGALVFAIQGGEYGTSDLWNLRSRRLSLEARLDTLQRTVDSLDRYRRRLATDPALQERIAREEFGMVRGDKEMLYRFAEPSPRAGTDSAR